MSIFNKYKDTLEDFIDSLDVEHPAISRQINLLSNDIPGSSNDPSDSKIDNHFSDRLQRQQQRRITPSLILGLKNGNEKVRRGKKKRDNGKYQGGKKKAVGRRGGILEVSVY